MNIVNVSKIDFWNTDWRNRLGDCVQTPLFLSDTYVELIELEYIQFIILCADKIFRFICYSLDWLILLLIHNLCCLFQGEFADSIWVFWEQVFHHQLVQVQLLFMIVCFRYYIKNAFLNSQSNQITCIFACQRWVWFFVGKIDSFIVLRHFLSLCKDGETMVQFISRFWNIFW